MTTDEEVSIECPYCSKFQTIVVSKDIGEDPFWHHCNLCKKIFSVQLETEIKSKTSRVSCHEQDKVHSLVLYDKDRKTMDGVSYEVYFCTECLDYYHKRAGIFSRLKEGQYLEVTSGEANDRRTGKSLP